MPALTKAYLQEIDNANQPRRGKASIPVQFNPGSLRMQFDNKSEGGQQAGRQARQYVGSSSTTLTVDLVFDTADEGTTAAPKSVLEHIKPIEAFMVPQASGGKKQSPPRLRFQWGKLIVDGVMESLSVDLDHFAHDGTPLRAKAALSIKGQHPEFQFNQAGAGANTAAGVPPAGSSAGAGAAAAQPGARNNPLGDALAGVGSALAGVGSALGQANAFVSGLNDKVAQALDGESLAQLAQRNGLDPAAWRALAQGITDPLQLGAGVEVSLGGGAIGLGIGSQRGVGDGAAQDAATRAGLAAPAAAPTLQSGLERGYALSRAGGLGAALEATKTAQAAQASAKARQAFGGATAGAGSAGGSAGESSGGAAGAASAAGTPPGALSGPNAGAAVFTHRADPRAQSFGAGVPLRDQVLIAHEERANLLSGQARVRAGGLVLDGVPATTDPSVPGWLALPAHRGAAGSASPGSSGGHARRRAHGWRAGCGCVGCSGR